MLGRQTQVNDLVNLNAYGSKQDSNGSSDKWLSQEFNKNFETTVERSVDILSDYSQSTTQMNVGHEFDGQQLFAKPHFTLKKDHAHWVQAAQLLLAQTSLKN